MAIDVPPLTERQLSELADALYEWGKSHPRSGEPIMSFNGRRPLRPRDMAEEVMRQTPDGLALAHMVAVACEVEDFEEILSRFRPTGMLTL